MATTKRVIIKRFWVTLKCGHRRTVTHAEYDAGSIKCGRCITPTGRSKKVRINRNLNRAVKLEVKVTA